MFNERQQSTDMHTPGLQVYTMTMMIKSLHEPMAMTALTFLPADFNPTLRRAHHPPSRMSGVVMRLNAAREEDQRGMITTRKLEMLD